jgi:hypothetical protein
MPSRRIQYRGDATLAQKRLKRQLAKAYRKRKKAAKQLSLVQQTAAKHAALVAETIQSLDLVPRAQGIQVLAAASLAEPARPATGRATPWWGNWEHDPSTPVLMSRQPLLYPPLQSRIHQRMKGQPSLRYPSLRRIGQGGYGKVYAGQNLMSYHPSQRPTAASCVELLRDELNKK